MTDIMSPLERYVEMGDPQTFYIRNEEHSGILLSIVGLESLERHIQLS